MVEKDINRWNTNFIDFRDYCTRNIRLPRRGEVSGKTGVDLGGWYVNQTKDVKLTAFQNNMMISLLGPNWRAGIRASEEYLRNSTDLHKAFPQLKDNGYDFSILTLCDRGILSKGDTLSYINKGVTSLYKLHEVDEDLCSYENISKLVSLPPKEYCNLYICVNGIKGGIVSTFKSNIFDDMLGFCKALISINYLGTIRDGDILLDFLRGTTMTEIAKQLGISKSCVNQRVSRALRKIAVSIKRDSIINNTNNIWDLPISTFVTAENIKYLNPLIRNGYRSIKDCSTFIHGSKSSSDIAAKLSCVKMRGIGAKGVVAISEILFQIKNKYNLE